MTKKKGAILCASGIGDGLLMMTAACHLKNASFDVTVFHNKAGTLSPLFPPSYTFLPYPDLETLAEFDAIFFENDHSASAEKLHRLRTNGSLKNVTFLLPKKSRFQQIGDCLFDQEISFVENINTFFSKKFNTPSSLSNDLLQPKREVNKKRVLIHPTSQDLNKCWKKRQFLKLRDHIKKRGYEPQFVTYINEAWSEGLHFSSMEELLLLLKDAAYFIGNDSMLGHLASNIGIPTLTIAGDAKRMKVWHPGWHHNICAAPMLPLPNFKGISLPIKSKWWQNFVTVRKVTTSFDALTKENTDL